MKKSISYKEEIKTVLAIFMFNLIVKKLSQSNFSPSTRKTDTFGEHLRMRNIHLFILHSRKRNINKLNVYVLENVNWIYLGIFIILEHLIIQIGIDLHGPSNSIQGILFQEQNSNSNNNYISLSFSFSLNS